MLLENKLVLATGNEGKKKEIEYLLRDFGLEIYSLRDFDGLPEVDEDQPTLEGNAEKKARVIHERVGMPTLADDTGLEVDALGGRPGVYSARYAGEDGNADANRELLLKEMRNQDNRAARFRTVLAYFINGEKYLFEGVCEGKIIDSERGIGGFGYDPVFVPKNSEMTFAEMSVEEKNKISHRGKALRKFAHYLSKK